MSYLIDEAQYNFIGNLWNIIDLLHKLKNMN